MCRIHYLFVVLVVAAAGCNASTSIDDVLCPNEGTKLTYASFGQNFFATNCQSCHGRSGDERRGAPSDYDFGTLEAIRAQREHIFDRAAGDNVSMPPGPDDPPETERYRLAEWLACGAP